MSKIQIPSDHQYQSWIKLEEKAKQVLTALNQHEQVLVIDNVENVHAAGVFVFDTTDYA